MNLKNHSLASAQRAFSALAGLILLILLAGCSGYSGGGPLPTPDGTTIKRLAIHDSIDYQYRWRAAAYERTRVRKPLSQDKADILAVCGQPDYVRIPFRSQFGEETEEWLYTGQDRLFQFVEDKLVHSQPVSDLERLLLRKGYPQYAFQTQPGRIPFRQTLIYRDWEGHDVEVYCLANGKLVVGGE